MKEANFYTDFQEILKLYDLSSFFSKEEYKSFIYRLIFLSFLEKSKFLSNNEFILKDLHSTLNFDYFKKIIIPILLKLVNDTEQEFPNNLKKDYNIKTQYLGNLFNIDDILELKSSNFPAGFWNNIFEVFNKYSWSINENDDEFDGITPKIFEYIYERDLLESLEGKKNVTGTVFTPPEVIDRILDNTIYPYINGILERENYEGNIKDILDKHKVEKCDLQKIKFLFEYLPKIKIIDNSCGGGSFLIRLKDKLLKIYMSLHDILRVTYESSEEIEFHDPLTTILRNNIYGVDLSKVVIDLIKMRFALSYLSYLNKNQGEFQALDLNFKNGNSLIGVVTKKDLLNLSKWREPIEQLDSKTEFLALFKEYFQRIISDKEKISSNQVNDEVNRRFLIKILRQANISLEKDKFNNLLPFHWIIEFPEVFYHSKEIKKEPGFDIIIGNPPYGDILSDREKAILKEELTSLEGKTGSLNVASIFIERSIKQLKSGGYLGFIVPNTITRKDEFTLIRNIMLEKTYLQKIVDEGNPFKDSNVTLEMVDLIFKKEVIDDYDIEVSIIRGEHVEKHILQKKKFKKYNWFVLHYDKILDKTNENSERLGYYGRFLSAKRPGKLNVEMRKDRGDIIAVKGSCVKPFYLKKDLKIEKNKNVEKYIGSLKYPLIILPEISNSTKASLCREDCVPISGVVIWSPNENAQAIKFFNSYLLLLLNSKLFAFYFNKYIINRSYLTTHLDSTYLERLPVKPIKNVKIFAHLSKFLLYLHEKIAQNSELIDFYKNEIMNPIIYSLYFFNPLESDILIKKIESLVDYRIKIDETEGHIIKALKNLKDKIAKNEEVSDLLKGIKENENVKYIDNYISQNIKY